MPKCLPDILHIIHIKEVMVFVHTFIDLIGPLLQKVDELLIARYCP
jgi:hypothetical protein